MTDRTPLQRALSMLRCPVTGDSLVFTPSGVQPFADDGFGVLTGGAAPYPVVDGIPILRMGEVAVQNHISGKVESPGPNVDEITALVNAGRCRDALLALMPLTPNPQIRGHRVRGSGRLLSLRPVSNAARKARARTMRRRLAAGRREGSLDWWLELLHARCQGMDHELLPYFLHRSIQPRYLAAQAALRPVCATSGPVLDLACGAGHLSAEVLRSDAVRRSAQAARSDDAEPRLVIGIDRTFHQLWLAQHWIAPTAAFVCADAAATLPLPDRSVAAAFCSDAFYFLPEPEAVLAELVRVCPSGPIVLTRLANAEHEPHEGRERDPAGWAAIAGGLPHFLTGERQLTRSYLDRTPLEPLSPTIATDEKWLTLCVSAEAAALANVEAPADWPHARGTLRLNPIYQQKGQADGSVNLTLHMPSPWYESENSELRQYHPEHVSVSATAMADLKGGRDTEELRRLAADFVLIGGEAAADRH